MVRDAPPRRLNGQPESLRWQPTRRGRERKLRTAFRAGRQIDLTPGGRAAGNGHRAARRAVVRAEVIAALLCAESGPRNIVRLTLCGARVTGRLDLRCARVDYPITLRDCVFDQPLMLAGARLGALTLDGSAFPGVDGTNLHVDGDLGLSRVRSSGPVILAESILPRFAGNASAPLPARNGAVSLCPG